jgi:hypothetical protein
MRNYSYHSFNTDPLDNGGVGSRLHSHRVCWVSAVKNNKDNYRTIESQQYLIERWIYKNTKDPNRHDIFKKTFAFLFSYTTSTTGAHHVFKILKIQEFKVCTYMTFDVLVWYESICTVRRSVEMRDRYPDVFLWVRRLPYIYLNNVYQFTPFM